MLKTGKMFKMEYLLALTALLLLPCISLMQTRAATEVDRNRECSLTVSVETGGSIGSSDAYLEDFNRMKIPVAVYRVADVDLTGQNFTPEGVFSEMDFGTMNGDPSSAAAKDWQALAGEAEKIVSSAFVPADASVTIQRTQEGEGAAKGVITGLSPGLYLIVPKETYNPEYTVLYTFTPYLTALPGSAYTVTGEGSDAWVYDTVIGLKPEADRQFGKLNIRKTLETYNEALGKATFVFHIIGTDPAGTVQYDEVESMTFASAGSKTLTIDQIPAGLSVTVTEVYSGASYTVSGSGEETVLIVSDAAAGADAAQEASVVLTNRYNGGNRGGYGVTNRFESDGNGGWTWNNPTVSDGE